VLLLRLTEGPDLEIFLGFERGVYKFRGPRSEKYFFCFFCFEPIPCITVDH